MHTQNFYRFSGVISAFVLILVVVVVPFAVPQQVSATTWTTGQFDTGTNNTNNFSALSIASDGTIYGSWLVSDVGTSFVKIGRWTGSSWQIVSQFTPTTINQPGRADFISGHQHSLMVDSNGDYHIAFHAGQTGACCSQRRGVWYAFYDASAGTWSFSEVQTYTDPSGWKDSFDFQMMVASDISRSIVFRYTDANGSRQTILRLATSANGTTWSFTDLQTVTGSSDDFDGFSAAIDSANKIHLSYYKEAGPDIYTDGHNLIYATNASGTWQFTTIQSSSVEERTGQVTRIDVDSTNKAHIVYIVWNELNQITFDYTEKLIYATNASGSWTFTPLKQLSNESFLYMDAGVSDNASYKAITFIEGSSGTTQDVLTQSGSGAWQEEAMYTGTTSWSTVDVNNTGRVMSLFEEGSGTNRRLYYATGTLQGNTAPTTTGIPDIRKLVGEGGSTPVNLTSYFADAEDGAAGLVYSVQGNTNPAVASINLVGSILTVSYGAATPGKTFITVRATDSGNQTVEAILRVSVKALYANSDFNADGIADIPWRNISDGSNSLWTLNQTPAVNNVTQPPRIASQDWQIAAVGDFNADDRADFLWRNRVEQDGRVSMWLMNGATRTGDIALSAIKSQLWQVAGVGDFNGDGFTDVFWRNTSSGDNTIWFMNGTASPTSTPATKVGTTAWRVVGSGDTNQDGKDDIFWRNTSTGQNALWQMNGATETNLSLSTVAGSNWTVADIGDYDFDHDADILWRNTSTGDTTIWRMQGATKQGDVSLPQVSDTTWKVAATGDYNKNGTTDLLWRRQNTSSLPNTIWLMDDAAQQAESVNLDQAAIDWKVVGTGSANTGEAGLNTILTPEEAAQRGLTSPFAPGPPSVPPATQAPDAPMSTDGLSAPMELAAPGSSPDSDPAQTQRFLYLPMLQQ